MFRRGFFLLCCAALVWSTTPATGQASSDAPLVMIDPGHGGRDPGAVDKANGVMEKTINLAVARRLAGLLREQGFRVRMTRVDDGLDSRPMVGGEAQNSPGLPERVALANRSQADLFISLHVNSFRDPRCRGAEVFFCLDSPQGARLAQHLRRLLVARVQDCKVRPGDYYVLRQTNMPAVLVEMGYLSNPREGRLLCQSRYQNDLARIIAQAVKAYFAERRRQGMSA